MIISSDILKAHLDLNFSSQFPNYFHPKINNLIFLVKGKHFFLHLFSLLDPNRIKFLCSQNSESNFLFSFRSILIFSETNILFFLLCLSNKKMSFPLYLLHLYLKCPNQTLKSFNYPFLNLFYSILCKNTIKANKIFASTFKLTVLAFLNIFSKILN